MCLCILIIVCFLVPNQIDEERLLKFVACSSPEGKIAWVAVATLYYGRAARLQEKRRLYDYYRRKALKDVSSANSYWHAFIDNCAKI